jgi:lysophospholipase L1-like esterase
VKYLDAKLFVIVCFAITGCGDQAQPPAQPRAVNVLGETMTFRGAEKRTPYFPCSGVLRVYSYLSDGSVKDYAAGTDYLVTDQCTLSRTTGSAIPDILNYTYIDTSGNPATVAEELPYEFYYTPVRNPPGIMTYNVYIDYMSAPQLPVIGRAAKRYSNVFIFGDSIAGGANTAALFFFNETTDSFAGKLRNAFPDVKFTNQFQNGGSIETLTAKVDSYLADHPDLVLIEFGMNDHIEGPANLANFKGQLDTLTSKFLANGVDVILVGFFQQNRRWVLENPTDTESYNASIQAVAEAHSVPFIDIRSEFAKLSASGKRLEDMTGDFFHHPTGFGHSIYFSMIAPFVAQNDEVIISDYLLALE